MPQYSDVLAQPSRCPGGGGDKNIFLVDLDRDWTRPFYLGWSEDAKAKQDPVFLARFPDGKRRFPGHEMWSNDGLQVGYTLVTGPWRFDNIVPRQWVIGNILNPDCTFRTTNPDGTSNVEGTSGIAARTFKGTAITNSTGALYSEVPKFCSWSADDQHFACSGHQLATSDTEGQSAIFLLNRSTGARRWLTMTHEVPDDGDGDYYPGQSHLQFAGNKTTILFDSDRRIGMNNWAQVYKATYPSSMLP